MPIPVRTRPISLIGLKKSSLTDDADNTDGRDANVTGIPSMASTGSKKNTRDSQLTAPSDESTKVANSGVVKKISTVPVLSQTSNRMKPALPGTRFQSTTVPALRSVKPATFNHQDVAQDDDSHNSRNTRQLGHLRTRSEITYLGDKSRQIVPRGNNTMNSKSALVTDPKLRVEQKISQTGLTRKQGLVESSLQSLDMRRPELSRLQNELWQLSIVYQDSWRVLKDYKASADQALTARQQVLRQENLSLSAMEAEHQAAINIATLQTWLQAESSDPGQDKITALCACIRHLTEISSQDSTFETAIAEFEKWQADLLATSASGVSSLPQISTTWLHTVSDLEQKLQVFQHSLNSLGKADNISSGLGMTLDGHQQLVDTMLAEIIACREIYNLAKRRETARAQHTLELAIRESKMAQSVSSTPRTPVWDEKYARTS